MPEQKFTGDVDDLWDKLQTGGYVVVRRDTMRQIERRLQVVSPTDTDAIAIDLALAKLEQLGQMKQRYNRGLLINLGSGQRPFDPPWINVDKQEKWNPDVIADGANLKDHFKDESAAMIVLSHTLEHYGANEGNAMVSECYRILKPGGCLIVSVPDMDALARGYLEGRISVETWLINIYGAYHGDEADRHKFGFVAETLDKTLMRAAPWKRIGPFDYRKIPGMDVAKDWWILSAEALK